jgi:hypothetical protein
MAILLHVLIKTLQTYFPLTEFFNIRAEGAQVDIDDYFDGKGCLDVEKLYKQKFCERLFRNPLTNSEEASLKVLSSARSNVYKHFIDIDDKEFEAKFNTVPNAINGKEEKPMPERFFGDLKKLNIGGKIVYDEKSGNKEA